MTAGTPVTIRFQQRDNFGNIVTSTDVQLGSSVVTIELGPKNAEAGVVDSGTCDHDTDAGAGNFYECTITPHTAGERELMIRIDGLDTRKVTSDSSGITMTSGPFQVEVAPGPASYLHTGVVDLSVTQFIAGRPEQYILIQLRDAQGNDLTSSCNGCLTAELGTQTLYVTDLQNGQMKAVVG